jgi:hypothetical protein
LRRTLREQFRTAVLPRLGALDVVVRTLPGAYATDEGELRSELMTLAEHVAGGAR